MSTTLDLNTQMILMRKEIKRAKIWTISKLVRHMKNIRQKNGTEAQKVKNARRANRLYMEIEKLKDLEPDTIFKALLQSTISQNYVVNSTLSCKEKAISRIGSVSFIKERIEDIKSWINNFAMEHSTKKLGECLDSKTMNAIQSDGNDQNSIQHTHERKAVDLTSLNETNKKEATQLQEKLGQEKNFISKKNSMKDLSWKEKYSDEDDTEKYENISEYDGLENDDEIPKNKVDSSEGDINETLEELVMETKVEKNQIVVPLVFSKNFKEDKQEKEKGDFATIIETKGAEDVTEVLSNIGQGFDTHEEITDDVIEFEDLMKSQARRVGRKSECEEIPHKLDMFFTHIEGSTGGRFRHFHKKETVVEGTGSDLKSSFMGSLSKLESSIKGKKNRPSQRSRRKAHIKDISHNQQCRNDTMQLSKDHKIATTKGSVKKSNKNIADKTECTELHPSWKASRKRKQEHSALKTFKGKRVCFSDSD